MMMMNDVVLFLQLASTVDVTPSNKLTILRKIGNGGFGDVHYARHRDWSEVAYKKLVVTFIKPDERYKCRVGQQFTLQKQV